MLDARLVTTVLEIAGELNLRAVARRFGVHPSTVTRRLQRAEALLGVRLFRRTRRFVAATPEGEALLEALRALDDAHRATGRRAREVEDGDAGVVRVGVVGPPTDEVHGVLRVLRSAVPGWSVDVRPTTWPDGYVAVEHARMDVVVGAGPMRRGLRPRGTPRAEGGRGRTHRIGAGWTEEHTAFVRGDWMGPHAKAARSWLRRLEREVRLRHHPPLSLEDHIHAYVTRPVDEDDEWLDHLDPAEAAAALAAAASSRGTAG
ncbi:LysR family transcriptional regulator [Patulibacter sp. S7RM1-6]